MAYINLDSILSQAQVTISLSVRNNCINIEIHDIGVQKEVKYLLLNTSNKYRGLSFFGTDNGGQLQLSDPTKRSEVMNAIGAYLFSVMRLTVEYIKE